MERGSITRKKWLSFSAVLVDMALVNLSAVLAFRLRFKGPPPRFNYLAYLNIAPFMTGMMCLIYYVFDLYDTKRSHNRAEVIFNVLKGASLGFVILAGFTFFSRQFSFPRLALIIFYFLNILLLSLWHTILITMNNYLAYPLGKKQAKRRILIVGAGDSGQKTAQALYRQPRRDVDIVGFIDDSEKEEIETTHLHLLGKFNQLRDVLLDKNIDEVIFSTQALSPRKMMELLEVCVKLDVKFMVEPELLDIAMGRPKYRYEYNIPLIDLTIEPIRGWQANLKRMADILSSFIGALFMLVGIPIIAMADKISSPGPLFYKQERCGRNGKSFSVLKFRTMALDAEEETGPVWAGKDDSRATKFGEFLRRTHIDELPQVINILKGEMSIVGPRPERPAFAKSFLDTIPFYKNRLLVAPGLTGWAQVNQEADETIEDVKKKLKYDLFYIENMSIFLDMQIILRTALTLCRHSLRK